VSSNKDSIANFTRHNHTDEKLVSQFCAMICLLSADLVDDQEVKEEIEKITIEAKNNLEKFKRDNDVRRRSSHNVRRYKELTILRMFTSHIPPASSLYIVN